MKGSYCSLILTSFFLLQVNSNPVDLGPNFLLGSLKNVTQSASNFLSDSIHKQTEILLQVKNTATNYAGYHVIRTFKRSGCTEKNTNRCAKHDKTLQIVDSTASKGMEIKIRTLLEILRANMPYGIPVLNLPVLEPLRIEHKDFQINNKEIGNISGVIENATVSGLSTFVIDDVKLTLLNGLSLAVNFSIPTIRANGMYQLSGMFGKLFAVDGSGPFNLDAYGSRFYVHIVLEYTGTMHVKSLDFDFSVQSVKAVFRNLFKNPEVNDTINEVLSKLAPELLDTLKPVFKPMIEEMLAQQVNATVTRLTLGNIIEILTGKADIHNFAHLVTP